MSVVVVNEGVWLAGNNAALTPAIPTGGQTGDTVICLGYVRENGATLGITAGWSEISTFAAPAHEMRGSVWSKAWTSGMTNPTVTPAGSGSNDTTLATCILLRGTIYSTTVLAAGNIQALGSCAFSGNALVPGDTVLYTGFIYTNSAMQSTIAAHATGVMTDQTESSSPQRFWANGINSALGADSSGEWALFEVPTDIHGTSPMLEILYSYNDSSSSTLQFRIKFTSDAPTNLPPVYAVDSNIDLVFGSNGGIGKPTFWTPSGNVDLIVEWAGLLEGEEARKHFANLDVIVGWNGTMTLEAGLPKAEAWGVHLAWDFIANPRVLNSTWTVLVKLNGVAIPATSITFRRTLTTTEAMISSPAELNPALGQDVEIIVTFMKGTAQEMVVQSVVADIVETSYRYPATTLLASRIDSVVNGVAWVPRHLIYLTNSRRRAEVDWFVRPGDFIDGLTITEVVTVLGWQSWFTEVSCG